MGISAMNYLKRKIDAFLLDWKSRNHLPLLVKGEHYPDIAFGVKLTGGNVGFENSIYTFPHFCAFLIPRFLSVL